MTVDSTCRESPGSTLGQGGAIRELGDTTQILGDVTQKQGKYPCFWVT